MKYKESVFNIGFEAKGKKVIYNTYTGALSIIDKKITEITDESTILELLAQGFLVYKDINEINRLIVERNQAIFDSDPEHLHFEISPTLSCQADCWYCFEKRDENHSMSSNVVDETKDYIIEKIETSRCKEVSILFFGGEPFLAFGTMLNICESVQRTCNDKGILFGVTIISNGILATEERIKQIKEIVSIDEIQITLDGLEVRHNKNKGICCFNDVIKNIRSICEEVNVRVRINVSTENQEDIMPLIVYLLEDEELDGKIDLYLARVDDDDSNLGEESHKLIMNNKNFAIFRNRIITECMDRYESFDLDELLPEVKRNYCGYECCPQIMIGPLGELYHCQRDLGKKENTVGTVLEGLYYTDYQTQLIKELDDKCTNNCELLPMCFGGCPHDREKAINTDLCALRKEVLVNDLKTYINTMFE